MEIAHIKVPGSTANLGPGYDCLGIALAIYNHVSVELCSGTTLDPMAEQAADAFFRESGLPKFPFRWRIEGDVPQSRGLGSSVTVRLGILHGLNALAGGKLEGKDLLEICSDLEGHPDNAIPAALGGFVVARSKTQFCRFEVDPKLSFVLLIPAFEVLTSKARRVLPSHVPHSEAAKNSANAAIITAAFASGEYNKLKDAFTDYLHQPYREPLIPFLNQVIAAGESAGALGGFLSGSGSTIACMTMEDPVAVGKAMKQAAQSDTARILITTADNQGVQLIDNKADDTKCAAG